MILNIVIAVVVFVIGSLVAYRYWFGIWPGSRVIIEDPPESAPKVSPTNANFMFFYTDWCPYSENAQEPWKSFKQSMKNDPKKYGGKTITFEEIDGDLAKGRLAMYKVNEFPTFKVQTDKKVYKMLGKPTPARFRAFLIAALGKESS